MRPADHHDMTDWQDNAPPPARWVVAWRLAMLMGILAFCGLFWWGFVEVVMWAWRALS